MLGRDRYMTMACTEDTDRRLASCLQYGGTARHPRALMQPRPNRVAARSLNKGKVVFAMKARLLAPGAVSCTEAVGGDVHYGTEARQALTATRGLPGTAFTVRGHCYARRALSMLLTTRHEKLDHCFAP